MRRATAFPTPLSRVHQRQGTLRNVLQPLAVITEARYSRLGEASTETLATELAVAPRWKPLRLRLRDVVAS